MADDPKQHTQKIKGMMQELVTHLREDVGKVEDPRAEALFETSAEVLEGLMTPLATSRSATRRRGESRELDLADVAGLNLRLKEARSLREATDNTGRRNPGHHASGGDRPLRQPHTAHRISLCLN